MNNHTAAASLGEGTSPTVLSGVPLYEIGYWFDTNEITPKPADPTLLTTETWPERTQGVVEAYFDSQIYYGTYQVSSSISFHGSNPAVVFDHNDQLNLGGGNFTIMTYGNVTAAADYVTANWVGKKASTATGDAGFRWEGIVGDVYLSDGTNSITLTAPTDSVSGTRIYYVTYEDGTLTAGYVNGVDSISEYSTTGTPVGDWSNTETMYWDDPNSDFQAGYFGVLLGYKVGLTELAAQYKPADARTYTRGAFMYDLNTFLSSYTNRLINPYA